MHNLINFKNLEKSVRQIQLKVFNLNNIADEGELFFFLLKFFYFSSFVDFVQLEPIGCFKCVL